MKKYLKFIFITFIIIIACLSLVNLTLLSYSDYIFKKDIRSSSVAIDIVFVATEKDFDVLPYSVKSIRKYLKQPINKIVLISPNTKKAHELSKSLNMDFIDENKLLDFNKLKQWIDINNLSNNYGGSWNWYYQQFLKLIYYKISESQYYYVVDADLVMERPFVLISNEGTKTFFVGENGGNGGQKEAAISIKKLLGEDQFVPEFAFIADSMCFDKNIVENMINKIERRFSTEFYKAAILVEQNSNARFSEYELYGVYANFNSESGCFNPKLTNYINMPDRRNMRRKNTLLLDRYLAKLKQYQYISYHSWLND